MGYFSNGTEGEIYRDDYCQRCLHWQDLDDGRGEGCPVWNLHLIFNRDQLNSEGEPEGPIHWILSTLIPEKRGHNDQCAMFVTVETRLKRGQVEMTQLDSQ